MKGIKKMIMKYFFIIGIAVLGINYQIFSIEDDDYCSLRGGSNMLSKVIAEKGEEIGKIKKEKQSAIKHGDRKGEACANVKLGLIFSGMAATKAIKDCIEDKQ